MMITKATVWNAKAITDMWVDMMRETRLVDVDDDNAEQFYIYTIARIKNPRWITYVLYDDKPVGFISGEIRYEDYSTTKVIAFCECLYISKSHRNKGYDMELINAALEDAKSASEIEFIGAYSPLLIGAWEKSGFTPVRVTYRKKLED